MRKIVFAYFIAAMCRVAANVPDGYELVFSDEFDGPRLDTAKWWTRYVYEGGTLDHFNDERQNYRENGNHIFTNGALSLVAREVANPNAPDDPLPKFESGLIRSKKTFKYGYFETRMKVPGARGVWPAFWLCGDTAADGVAFWPPEIDILELVNNGDGDDIPSRYHVNCIVRADGGNNPWDGAQIFKTPELHGTGSGGYYRSDFDFSNDYHIYACLWETDDTVSFFLDGKKFLTVKYNWLDKHGAEPPWPSVIFNLAVGGAWAGRHGIDTATFPQSLDIDYVRVWQKTGARNVRDTVVGKDLIYKTTQSTQQNENTMKQNSSVTLAATAAALLATAASALDLTLTPDGIALRAGERLGVTLRYPELDNARRVKLEIVDDSRARLEYSTGAILNLAVGADGAITLAAAKLTGAENGISHQFNFPTRPAAGNFQYSTDNPERKPVPADKTEDGFVFRGDNKRFELADGENGFVITLPYGYHEFKDFRVWGNNQTFEWKSHSHFPQNETYIYRVAASDGSPPKIQKAKIDLANLDRYIPYPAANDESAWPGKGPIRTFDFMHGIRQNYFNNRARDENAFVVTGDSLTENFRDIQKRFPQIKIANRGVGGDTSRGVLYRFPIEVITLKPQGIMICAGNNDLTAHGDPAHAVSNIREMLALAAAFDSKMPVVLCTVPMSSQANAPIKPGARESLNEGVRKLAAEFGNVTLLDLDAALQNPDGTQNLDCYASDRLHVAEKGYDKWAELLAPLLANKPGADSPKNPAKIDLSKFKLVWSDEFDGDTLDRTKWDTPHQDRQDGSRWHTRNVTVKDGTCRIAILKTDDPKWRYSSACIRTSTGYETDKYLYAFKYGYTETRCRLPKHARGDYWAAFWMAAADMVHGRTADTRKGTEIDIFETFNLWNRGRMAHNLHWGGYGAGHNAGGFDSGEHRELLDGEFHTFGLYWDEAEYVFYIDGVEVARTDAKGLGTDKDGKTKPLG
ncbi:MAG: family 16 glycosylhydrolase, partial [Kiritimatiellaeota bacterium]|nr:family 16 glycosylhydrolase [Kiritimatiellota bacterium]